MFCISVIQKSIVRLSEYPETKWMTTKKIFLKVATHSIHSVSRWNKIILKVSPK